MRLKLSPKEALLKLDKLVADSSGQLLALQQDFHTKWDRWEEKIRNPEMPADFASSFGLSSQYVKPIGYVEPVLTEDEITEYEQRFRQWQRGVTDTLKTIFIDFIPVYTFMSAEGAQKIVENSQDLTRYYRLRNTFQAKLKVLADHYNDIKDSVRSPLFYLPDRAIICFYDFVCPLKVDSNEASVCAFMFQYSIGEKVEMIDAYNHMFGEQRTTLGVAEKDKIKNAIDGINRKTNRAFGFPIIAKDTVTISLTIPARITQNLL